MVCANEIEDKKIHQLTRHIWLKKLAYLYFKRKANFPRPKFLFRYAAQKLQMMPKR